MPLQFIMKILIASDHGGFALKQDILKFLTENKIAFEDLGCESDASVDYPDYAVALASLISQGKAERGILLCGTGVGMAITANKFKGVRAAAITDTATAKLAREHNDLNVLALGGRVLSPPVAREIVRVFIETPVAGGRNEKRVEKIK